MVIENKWVYGMNESKIDKEVKQIEVKNINTNEIKKHVADELLAILVTFRRLSMTFAAARDC